MSGCFWVTGLFELSGSFWLFLAVLAMLPGGTGRLHPSGVTVDTFQYATD